jgi:hypothetical protein
MGTPTCWMVDKSAGHVISEWRRKRGCTCRTCSSDEILYDVEFDIVCKQSVTRERHGNEGIRRFPLLLELDVDEMFVGVLTESTRDLKGSHDGSKRNSTDTISHASMIYDTEF